MIRSFGHISRIIRLVLLLGLLTTPATLLARDGPRIEVIESSNAFPSPSALIEVLNEQGQPVSDLRPEHFTILQNGQPVAPDRVVIAEEQTGSRGPVLGIVLDASQLLGAAEVEAARQAAIGLLESGTGINPDDPQLVSLFLPTGDGTQVSQITEFADFTHDHNAVINYLNTQLTLQPRATRLYAAVSEAVDAVAEQANEQGTTGSLVVLSDGRDDLSRESYESVLSLARDQSITIHTYRFGFDPEDGDGAARLIELSQATDGMTLVRPTVDEASASYRENVQVPSSSAYRVQFASDVPADEQTHRWQILAVVDGVEASSQQLLFQAIVNAMTLRPLGEVLQDYFLRAGLAALVVSGLITLGLALWQRRGREDSRRLRSGSLSHAATVKRGGQRS